MKKKQEELELSVERKRERVREQFRDSDGV